MSEVIASERMDRKEVRVGYKIRVCERLNETGMIVREGTSGYRVHKGRTKGNACWHDEI